MYREEGDSVLFVDDDTDVVSDGDPGNLIQKIQKEADLSCSWLQDNRMVVAGEKSKLLIIGTKELKRRRLGDNLHSIQVDGKTVSETPSEKLLGVIVNNHMTWHEHLHGEQWRTEEDNNMGLIPQLSQRVGILRKLSRYTSKKKLKMLISGIFYSKLSYCLPLFSNTWDLDNYSEVVQRFSSYTKEDNRKLQVLQNQVSRLQLDYHDQERSRRRKQNMSTKELLEKTGDLSVHQLGAQSTLIMVRKIITSKKPSYLSDRLITTQPLNNRSELATMTTSLNLRKSSFLYRGIKLFNQLPEELRKATEMTEFKDMSRKWVVENVNEETQLKRLTSLGVAKN